MFITFESPRSLKAKLELIQEEGLGGVMFWELSGDVRDPESENSLLGTIHRELGGE
jgi:chitinase